MHHQMNCVLKNVPVCVIGQLVHYKLLSEQLQTPVYIRDIFIEEYQVVGFEIFYEDYTKSQYNAYWYANDDTGIFKLVSSGFHFHYEIDLESETDLELLMTNGICVLKKTNLAMLASAYMSDVKEGTPVPFTEIDEIAVNEPTQITHVEPRIADELAHHAQVEPRIVDEAPTQITPDEAP